MGGGSSTLRRFTESVLLTRGQKNGVARSVSGAEKVLLRPTTSLFTREARPHARNVRTNDTGFGRQGAIVLMALEGTQCALGVTNSFLGMQSGLCQTGPGCIPCSCDHSAAHKDDMR